MWLVIWSVIQDYIQAHVWRENGVGSMFVRWIGYHCFEICKLHRQAYMCYTAKLIHECTN